VTLDERFAVLREIDWEALNEDQPPLVFSAIGKMKDAPHPFV